LDEEREHASRVLLFDEFSARLAIACPPTERHLGALILTPGYGWRCSRETHDAACHIFARHPVRSSEPIEGDAAGVKSGTSIWPAGRRAARTGAVGRVRLAPAREVGEPGQAGDASEADGHPAENGDIAADSGGSASRVCAWTAA
jgi:hypothetical protein